MLGEFLLGLSRVTFVGVDDTFADKVNSTITFYVLLILSFSLGLHVYVNNPIYCVRPRSVNDVSENFIDRFCYSNNGLYNFNSTGAIGKRLVYYPYVGYILGMCIILHYIPYILTKEVKINRILHCVSYSIIVLIMTAPLKLLDSDNYPSTVICLFKLLSLGSVQKEYVICTLTVSS